MLDWRKGRTNGRTGKLVTFWEASAWTASLSRFDGIDDCSWCEDWLESLFTSWSCLWKSGIASPSVCKHHHQQPPQPHHHHHHHPPHLRKSPPLILTHQGANEDDMLTSNLQTSLLTVSPVAAEISSPNLINEQRNLNNDHITFGEPPSQKIAFVHWPGLLLKSLNGCHLLTGERGKWAWYASPADRREPPPLIGGSLNFSPISLLGVERNRKAKAALADWRFA